MLSLLSRPRRNRKTESIRDLLRETHLSTNDLVQPLFIVAGKGERQPISAMPDIFRYSIDQAVLEAKDLWQKGIKAVALFPVVDGKLKTENGIEALNKQGLVVQAIRQLKSSLPDLVVVTDLALDPFTTHGHDGILKDGVILNDETVECLSHMAVLHAGAGADLVAPSDMMDGRVGAIRKELDRANFIETGILSYTAKYASGFYGPFRDALNSAPKIGDKKTYQMDPANRREALREAELDIAEGADILMVKPALIYLDVIQSLRTANSLPIAAYNVSGEYSMIKAAAAKGWLDEKNCVLEVLTSIKRAGADIIFTYHAKQAADWLTK